MKHSGSLWYPTHQQLSTEQISLDSGSNLPGRRGTNATQCLHAPTWSANPEWHHGWWCRKLLSSDTFCWHSTWQIQSTHFRFLNNSVHLLLFQPLSLEATDFCLPPTFIPACANLFHEVNWWMQGLAQPALNHLVSSLKNPANLKHLRAFKCSTVKNARLNYYFQKGNTNENIPPYLFKDLSILCQNATSNYAAGSLTSSDFKGNSCGIML